MTRVTDHHGNGSIKEESFSSRTTDSNSSVQKGFGDGSVEKSLLAFTYDYVSRELPS